MRDALRCLLLVLVFSLGACADDSPGRDVVAALPSSVADTMYVGQRITVGVRCVDRAERTVDFPVQWFSVIPAIADVRPAGAEATVLALHPGETFVWSLCDRSMAGRRRILYPDWNPLPETWVARRIVVLDDTIATWGIENATAEVVLRAPSAEDSVTGVTRLLSARGRSVSGGVIPPEWFTWQIDDPAIATVTPDGVLRARRAGRATAVAVRGWESRSVAIEVRDLPSDGQFDVALVDAHWTQAVQDERQTVPIIRGGRAAVVNILAFATPGAPTRNAQVRVFDSSGNEVWRASSPIRPDSVRAPGFARPNAQVIVPPPVIAVASSWRVHVEHPELERDVDATNDQLPRQGNESLRVVTPPVLRLHLVPLRLRAHGGITTEITDEHFEYYTWHTSKRLPVGAIEVSVGAPLESDANFFNEGGATVAGDSWFFHRVLTEVDAARVADPARNDRIWIGVIPAIASPSRWGGMGYLPTYPSDVGPMTRTQVVWGHERYPTGPRSSGSIVAHELGHNFGRRHAPCGDVGSSDPVFPDPQGRVGKWSMITDYLTSGDSSTLGTVPDSYGDMMGYCTPRWISAYTYLGILGFRDLQGAALRAEVERGPVLVVRGTKNGNMLSLSVLREGEGEVILGAADSPIEIELLADGDRVLERIPALIGTISEEQAQSFAAHIALTPARRAALRAIRVRAGTVNVRRELP